MSTHTRGWLLVAVQAGLLVALVVLPWRTLGSTGAVPLWVSGLGLTVAIAGLIFGVAGALALSTALTPTPVPKEGEVLRTHGAYRIVRHPLYTSVLTAAVGFTLAVGSWWQVGVCAALAVFFAYKSRWEDSMLADRFGEEWHDYARRTPGIIPLARRR